MAAHAYLRGRGLKWDLVLLNDYPGSYFDALQEQLARLFTPFSSGHQGTGLGLAIARALARAGGGDLVCADSAPGKTTFRFIFQPAEG